MTPLTDDKRADFLRTMRQRFTLAEEALVDLHAEAISDFQFRMGDQWDATVKAKRQKDGRPCFEINRIPQFLRQVTGEQKKDRPAIQVSPVGDGSDVETAEIGQGLVRHIERSSNAEDAYDTAFDHMATGGFGFLRLTTEYVDQDSANQEILLKREPNPFAHFPDPRCKELDYSDARFWFVIDTMSVEDFRDEYPESDIAGLTDFGGIADQAPNWITRDSVRVAEYFWVEVKREKRQLRDPETGKTTTREKRTRTVHWCKTNGIEILEETEIPGEYIPIVPVLGEEVLQQGKRKLIGIVRYAREPQRLYNLWQSAMAEAIALAPKAPWTATPTQVEGYEEIWEAANDTNFSYLPYNPDPKAPGPPQRNFAEPPIQAINVAIGHADNDLKNTTGLYNASLGAPGPEQSGKAILLRQKQGEGVTFWLLDSMKRAIKQCGRIIVGWIPHYYDAARVVKIVNPDGTSKTVQINQHFQDDAGLIKLFDLSVARFDVSIATGPSYDSMRAEAAQSMLQLVQAQPALMQVIGDLLVANFDWPMAKEIGERLKKMLPTQLQDQQGEGTQVPPQAQARMSQQDQMIQQLTGTVHALSAKLEAQQVKAASDERIALIRAKAGVMEAALKAKSAEAQMLFKADLDQIDRQLALLPDPAMDREAGPAQPNAPAAQAAPSAPAAPMPLAA